MSGSSADAVLATLLDRVEAQDERIRRIDVTLRALARMPANEPPTLPEADTKPLASALTPPVIPWRGRTVPEEELLRAAVDLASDAVVGLDAAGTVCVWNRAAVDLFGWLSNEVLGSMPPFLPDNKGDEHARLLRSVQPVELTTIRRRKSGDLVAVRVSVSSARSGGAVFVFRPTATTEANEPPSSPPPDPATERFAALGRTVAGVAHDFNNLLAVVHGHAELLAEQLPPGSPQRESADAIVATADTAAGVSKRLLGVARPDPSDQDSTDINLLLARLERIARAVVGAKVMTAVTLAPGLRPASIHSSDLTQVVLNLVTNAHDAMPGGGTLTLRTAMQVGGPDRPGWPTDVPAGEFVVLTVADTGVGMDEGTRLRAFDPMFTTKGEGTGLGLMAVREVVTRAGGHVEIESEPGWGTQVRVYLPPA